MKTELNSGEKVIKNGFANLLKGFEGVGGKLYLTSQRLIFESHAINIQRGVTQINLSDVSFLEKCWTKFHSIPLLPNCLLIRTNKGEEFRFVVNRRNLWASAVDSQKRLINI